MTPTDLRMRVSAGRAMLNYVADHAAASTCSQGVNLNLNFPSVVGTVKVGEREVEYGYSSGIYTKYVSTLTPIRSVPAQEEIDALGGGKTGQRLGRALRAGLPEVQGPERDPGRRRGADGRRSSGATCTARTASTPRTSGRRRS